MQDENGKTCVCVRVCLSLCVSVSVYWLVSIILYVLANTGIVPPNLLESCPRASYYSSLINTGERSLIAFHTQHATSF